MVRAQAVGLRQGSARNRTVAPGAGSWPPLGLSMMIQPTRATAAGIDQKASASFQDPVQIAIGTVRAPPIPAPSIKTALQIPVALPTAPGTCSRTRPGTNPAARAIPKPASSADRYKTPGTAPARRITKATTKTPSAIATVRLRPNRFETAGTANAKIPMHSTGMVVSAPSATSFQPNSARISTITSGTLEIAARRLPATSTRASIGAQAGTTRADRTGGSH